MSDCCSNATGIKSGEYDVIVVGAGIAGLVCAGYLSRAGMKVALLEKRPSAGGYCTSYVRGGFTFDAGVHGIGGMHPEGKAIKVISDFSLSVRFTQRTPAESIYFKNKYIIHFWEDVGATTDEFIRAFPREKENIQRFIAMVLGTPPLQLYFKFRKLTFAQFLDTFFHDEDLKSILKIPGGNAGISAGYGSALGMIGLYREFLFNPSKYPVGGMAVFAQALAKAVAASGGKLYFSHEAISLLVEDSRYQVTSARGLCVRAKKLVWAANAHSAAALTGAMCGARTFKRLLRRFPVSPSAYFINFGLKEDRIVSLNKIACHNLWFFPQDDTDRVFLNAAGTFHENYFESRSLFMSFPSPRTWRFLILAPFMSEEYWEENKEIVLNNVLVRAQPFVEDMRAISKIVSINTPFDLKKFTSNDQGACYGWVPIPLADAPVSGFSKLGDGFYLCGHWAPSIFGSGGISTVINSAIACSDRILKKRKHPK